MTSNELRRKKRIETAIKACDKVAIEIQGTSLSDDEFKRLSEKLTTLMKIVYKQRSQRSAAASVAFNEAMEVLQKIRRVT